MSYGDPALPPASDPDATFLLYDDFDGTVLDTTNKWTDVNSGNGSITVSGGTVTIASDGVWSGTSDTSRYILSQSDMGTDFIAEALVTTWGTDYPDKIFGLRASEAAGSRMYVLGYALGFLVPFYRVSEGADATYDMASLSGFPGDGYLARFIRTGDTVEAYYNDQLLESRTVSGWDLGRVALTDTNGEGSPSVFDWVRVRAYLANEPVVTPHLDDTLNGTCGTCYDKSIGVDNSAGASVSGYQLRMVLDASHTDFWRNVTEYGDDIRFFDSDGFTPLDYWIEILEAPQTIFGFIRISAFSQGHTCAATSFGEAACWGMNGSYQVGDGSNADWSTPVAVDHDVAATLFGNTDLQSAVVAVSTGDTQSLAVHANGALSAWGNGGSGRRGIGTDATGGTPEAACIPVR
jgi:hypothetical protein